MPSGLYLPFRITNSDFVGESSSPSCCKLAESVETVDSTLVIVEFICGCVNDVVCIL